MIDLHNSAFVTVPAGLLCRGDGFRTANIPVHYGLLSRPHGRFWLIDTGYGPSVTTGSRSMALRVYNAVLRPRLEEASSPAKVLAGMGAKHADVEAVIVTHFHADHVARLNEFPHARIFAMGEAAKAMLAMSNAQAIRHGVFKELLPADLAQRLEPVEALPLAPSRTLFGEGYDLFGDGSCLAVSLPGHARGHFGLLLQGESGPLLYATDATWSMKALLQDRTPALSRAVVFDDRRNSRLTEMRLRDFVRAGGCVRLCHDLAQS